MGIGYTDPKSDRPKALVSLTIGETIGGSGKHDSSDARPFYTVARGRCTCR